MTDEGNGRPVPYQPLSPKEIREQTDALLDIARRVAGEGEPLVIDEDFDIEELAQFRSFLSQTRTAVDMVNGALARYWQEHYPGEAVEWEQGWWEVGHIKKRSFVDDEQFMTWIATKDAEELAKLFTPSRLAPVIKKTGMSPAEQDTHLVEEYNPNSGISINYKEKK